MSASPSSSSSSSNGAPKDSNRKPLLSRSVVEQIRLTWIDKKGSGGRGKSEENEEKINNGAKDTEIYDEKKGPGTHKEGKNGEVHKERKDADVHKRQKKAGVHNEKMDAEVHNDKKNAGVGVHHDKKDAGTHHEDSAVHRDKKDAGVHHDKKGAGTYHEDSAVHSDKKDAGVHHDKKDAGIHHENAAVHSDKKDVGDLHEDFAVHSDKKDAGVHHDKKDAEVHHHHSDRNGTETHHLDAGTHNDKKATGTHHEDAVHSDKKDAGVHHHHSDRNGTETHHLDAGIQNDKKGTGTHHEDAAVHNGKKDAEAHHDKNTAEAHHLDTEIHNGKKGAGVHRDKTDAEVHHHHTDKKGPGTHHDDAEVQDENKDAGIRNDKKDRGIHNDKKNRGVHSEKKDAEIGKEKLDQETQDESDQGKKVSFSNIQESDGVENLPPEDLTAENAVKTMTEKKSLRDSLQTENRSKATRSSQPRLKTNPSKALIAPLIKVHPPPKNPKTRHSFALPLVLPTENMGSPVRHGSFEVDEDTKKEFEKAKKSKQKSGRLSRKSVIPDWRDATEVDWDHPFPQTPVKFVFDHLYFNARRVCSLPARKPSPVYVDDKKGTRHKYCSSGLACHYVYKEDYGKIPEYLKERNRELGRPSQPDMRRFYRTHVCKYYHGHMHCKTCGRNVPTNRKGKGKRRTDQVDECGDPFAPPNSNKGFTKKRFDTSPKLGAALIKMLRSISPPLDFKDRKSKNDIKSRKSSNGMSGKGRSAPYLSVSQSRGSDFYRNQYSSKSIPESYRNVPSNFLAGQSVPLLLVNGGRGSSLNADQNGSRKVTQSGHLHSPWPGGKDKGNNDGLGMHGIKDDLGKSFSFGTASRDLGLGSINPSRSSSRISSSTSRMPSKVWHWG